jgi:hypothetical protein
LDLSINPEGFYLAPRIPLFLFFPILALVLVPGLLGSGEAVQPPVENKLGDWTIPGIIKRFYDEGKKETAELLEGIWELIQQIPEMIVGTISDFIDYLAGIYKSFNDALIKGIQGLIPEPAQDTMDDWGVLNATTTLLSGIFQFAILIGMIRIYKLVLDLAPLV